MDKVAERTMQDGRAEAVFQCVEEGDFDSDRGAVLLKIPGKEFLAQMKQAGYHIPNS